MKNHIVGLLIVLISMFFAEKVVAEQKTFDFLSPVKKNVLERTGLFMKINENLGLLPEVFSPAPLGGNIRRSESLIRQYEVICSVSICFRF